MLSIGVLVTRGQCRRLIYYRNYLVRYGIYRSPAGHSSNAFMVSMDAFQG